MRRNVLIALLLVLCTLPLVAQNETTPGEAAAGIAAMGGCMVFVLIMLAIQIFIMIWVYKDAKARGMDNAVLWLVIVLITGLIGLVIYLFVRPKGETMPCPSCGKKRMTGLPRCPNCGNP